MSLGHWDLLVLTFPIASHVLNFVIFLGMLQLATNRYIFWWQKKALYKRKVPIMWRPLLPPAWGMLGLRIGCLNWNILTVIFDGDSPISSNLLRTSTWRALGSRGRSVAPLFPACSNYARRYRVFFSARACKRVYLYRLPKCLPILSSPHIRISITGR